MAKKTMTKKDDFDRELEELNEDFDFNDGYEYEESLGEVVDHIFKTHFAKIDFALRLTQMALDQSTKKENNEDRVFEVYRRALKVINETPPVEETLRQFGLMSEPQ